MSSLVASRFFILIITLFAVACSVSDRVSYADQEGPIPDALIKKINTTKTEKAWVMAHLGEPFTIDRVETAGENSVVLYEVYSYRLSRSSIRSGHILYVFKAGGREDEVEYFHIVFDKGIVQKSWMDKYARAQLVPRLRYEKVNTVTVTSQKDADHVMKVKKMQWKIPILKKWFGGDKDTAKEAGDKASEMKPVMGAETTTDTKTDTKTEKVSSASGSADASGG